VDHIKYFYISYSIYYILLLGVRVGRVRRPRYGYLNWPGFSHYCCDNYSQ
jgi:hypothetical protein